MRPMLAEPTNIGIDKFVQSDSFWLEQKVDGVRLIVEVNAGSVVAYNRKGEEVSVPDKRIVTALHNLPYDAAFDGEWAGGKLWLFDLPVCAKHSEATLIDQTSMYAERRAALDVFGQAFPALSDGIVNVLPIARTTEEKLAWYRTLHGANVEGVMVKETTAPYVEGHRVDTIRKIKFWESCDVVVTEVGREGKRSVAVSVVDLLPSPHFVDIGSITVTEKWLDQLNVGDVIEAKYLYVPDADEPRLYQPAFLRRRTDKELAECTIDQLKVTNKQVLIP